jgi:hypothetical protein
VATGQPWCKSGLDQKNCHRLHVWSQIPRSRDRGQNRECPACHANFSINPADVPKVWMVGYCHAGCDAADIRQRLLGLGIPELCLGRFGQPSSSQTATAPVQRSGIDSASLAAIRRDQLYAKLAGSDLTNGSLLRMCIQAVSESNGDVPPDPEHLLPRDHGEFIALAKRTGIERCHCYKLARLWLGRYAVGVNP